MQRLLLLAAAICLVLALLWPLINKLGLGRLPGDLVFGKGRNKIYLPLTTSLLLSAVLILVLWIIRR